MACKTSLFLIKLITFTCTDLSPKKSYEAIKEKTGVISSWSHLNLCRHNFDFHLYNTFATVNLFIAVAVVAAATVVVPVIVAAGKNVQQ